MIFLIDPARMVALMGNATLFFAVFAR